MVTIPDRKEETLKLVAETWIDKRSIVYSDEWKAYRGALVEFDHRMVCHKKFINPESEVHTQQIEAFWSVFKRWLRRRGYNLGPLNNVTAYMIEFLFRRKITLFEDFLYYLNKYWDTQK